MGVTFKTILDWIAQILGPILDLMSPVLRKELEEAIKKIWDKAKASENPWDDHGIKLLADLLKIELAE